jgi:hypothetical protein
MSELNDRDRRILEHVIRYRLTIQEFLHRLFFADAQLNAVTKVTSRLTDAGWLARHELPRGRSYFVPGGRAVEAFSLPPGCTRPFSETTLPTAYGVLAYCVGSGNVRLTARDFETHLKALAVKGLIKDPHVIDKACQPHRLSLLIVDRDNTPERLLTKVARAVSKRHDEAAYERLIEEGRFSVTIVTATAEKQAATARLAERREDRSVPVSVAVAPELAHVWPEQIGRRTTDARAAREDAGHLRLREPPAAAGA